MSNKYQAIVMKADKIIHPYIYPSKDIAIDRITYLLDGKHTIPSAWGSNKDNIEKIEMLSKSIYQNDEDNDLLFNMLWEASYNNNPELSRIFKDNVNFTEFNTCVQFTQADGSWTQLLLKLEEK